MPLLDPSQPLPQPRDRAEWFAANVTSGTLVLRGRPVSWLFHEWKRDGSFYASLTAYVDLTVTRFALGRTSWSMPNHPVLEWSDERWQWGVEALDELGELDPADLVRVQAWLTEEAQSQ